MLTGKLSLQHIQIVLNIFSLSDDIPCFCNFDTQKTAEKTLAISRKLSKMMHTKSAAALQNTRMQRARENPWWLVITRWPIFKIGQFTKKENQPANAQAVPIRISQDCAAKTKNTKKFTSDAISNF